jgi:hypothetical protein
MKILALFVIFLLSTSTYAKVSDKVLKSRCNQQLLKKFSTDHLLTASEALEAGTFIRHSLVMAEPEYLDFLTTNSRAADVFTKALKEQLPKASHPNSSLVVSTLVEPAYFDNRNQNLIRFLRELNISKKGRSYRTKSQDLPHYSWVIDLEVTNPFTLLALAQHPAFMGFYLESEGESEEEPSFFTTTERAQARRLQRIQQTLVDYREEVERVERGIFNRYEREKQIARTRVYTFDGKPIENYKQKVLEEIAQLSDQPNAREKAQLHALSNFIESLEFLKSFLVERY